MSATIEARTAMRHLVKKAQEVAADPRLTSAQKSATLDKIEADIKSHSQTFALHNQALWLATGAESREGAGMFDDVVVRRRNLAAGLASQGYLPISAPQIDIAPEVAKELHEAAVSHKSLSIVTKATGCRPSQRDVSPPGCCRCCRRSQPRTPP